MQSHEGLFAALQVLLNLMPVEGLSGVVSQAVFLFLHSLKVRS